MESAPIQMLNIAYRSAASKRESGSWERLNHTMRAVLTAAVCGGMEFAEGDWARIENGYRSGRWLGSDREHWYALAVQMGNQSAVKAFEVAYARKPFIANDVEHGQNRHGYVHANETKRKRGRLAVGFRFPWQGQAVSVTSFADDGSYLVACLYERIPAEQCDHCQGWVRGGESKLVKRFKISHADLRKAGKAAKEEP